MRLAGVDNVRTNDPDTPAPLLGAKGNVSEGGIRVPFIIRGPGIEANSWSHGPIVGWDLFPTYAEWAEIDRADLPEGIEDGSIAAVHENGGSGEIQRSIPGLVFHFPHYQAGTPQSAIRVGDYKLIKYFESNEAVLFDIANDIGERHNLAAKMPGKAAELKALLDDYLQSVDAHMPVHNPDYDPAKVSWVGSRNYDLTIDPRWVYFPES